MSNPAANKRKGFQWQKDLVRDFRDIQLDGLVLETEELTLSGRDDEGDIAVRFSDRVRLMIEAKYAAMSPSHLDEAIVERPNYARARKLDPELVDAAVFYRRHGKPGLKNAQAVIPALEYIELLRIKADWLKSRA